MKKVKKVIIIAYIVLVSGHYGFGQQKVFHQVEELYKKGTIFTKSTGLLQPINNTTLLATAESAVGYQLNQEQLQKITNDKPNHLELQLRYKDSVYTLSLYQVELYKDNTHINTPSATNVSFQKGMHYRGVIKGNPNSLVSFNFYDTTCSAIISVKGLGNLVLGKTKDNVAESIYVMYNDKEIPNTFQCKIKKDNNDKVEKSYRQIDSTPRCVGLYFELTNNIYVQNNSNINTTMHWLTTLFNAVQTLYANEAIQVAISNVFIWTEPDPYEGSQDTYDALDLFISNRPAFQGDLGQLLSFSSLGGGLAYLDRLCQSGVKHSYSDASLFYNTFPLYSFTVHAITHEFGHLLGSNHTQACVWNGNNTAIDGCVNQEGNCAPAPVPAEGGTIMSYCHVNAVGVNFANGFGLQPRTLIQNNIAAALCLSGDCQNYCFDTLTFLDVVQTTNQVMVSWEDLNSNAVELSVRPMDSLTENWISTTTSPFTVQAVLQPNTYYIASLRYVCSSGFEWRKERLFVTPGDYCSGIVLTDSGGATNDYADNEQITRVIQPQNPQNAVRLHFTQFDLEDTYDFLYLYNGSSTEAEELTGGLTGYLEPFTIQSTAADGALTMQFVSDYFVTYPGYQATVDCSFLNTNDSFDYLDFSYWPNPAKNELFIHSKDLIQKVEIVDAKGTLLRSEYFQDDQIQLYLSDLSTGSYVLKIFFASGSSSIRVLKE